jgi:hypothetical protein
MSLYGAPPTGPDFKVWAEKFTSWLIRTRSFLTHRREYDSAAEDGVIMWDRQQGYPVVSKNGAFVQIVLEDGHANLIRTTDVTAAAINTAYAIQYDAPTGNVGISLDGTDPTKIVFAEAGEYLLMFSAQISSTSSSTVNFYFWPRLNGTDATGSTMKNALHQNGATLVVSRAAKFDVSAGDYLQVMWAVDSTSGFLDASAATAFSPAAPATTLAITRMHG